MASTKNFTALRLKASSQRLAKGLNLGLNNNVKTQIRAQGKFMALTTSVDLADCVGGRHRLHADSYTMFEQVVHAGSAWNHCMPTAARVGPAR